jgi:hypothetical protein
MMDKQERNLGVTEARFALTLLTCLLVAVGYVVLLRLGGTKDPTTDVGPDDTSPPITSTPHVPPVDHLPQVQVVPLEKPDAGPFERTSKRPSRETVPGSRPEPDRR